MAISFLAETKQHLVVPLHLLCIAETQTIEVRRRNQVPCTILGLPSPSAQGSAISKKGYWSKGFHPRVRFVGIPSLPHQLAGKDTCFEWGDRPLSGGSMASDHQTRHFNVGWHFIYYYIIDCTSRQFDYALHGKSNINKNKGTLTLLCIIVTPSWHRISP